MGGWGWLVCWMARWLDSVKVTGWVDLLVGGITVGGQITCLMAGWLAI